MLTEGANHVSGAPLLDDGEPFAEPQHRAGRQHLVIDSHSVDVSSVGAAEVTNRNDRAPADDLGVVARNSRLCQSEIAIVRAPQNPALID
jgi:hypothetical protein